MKQHINWPGLAFLALLLLIWEVAAWRQDNVNFPAVHALALAAWRDAGLLALQMGITLRRAATGFGLTLLGALPLGIALGRIRPLGQMFTR